MRLRSTNSRAYVDIPVDGGSADADRRRIGALLVESQRLTHEQVEAIVAHQAGSGELFGRTAVSLGLVDRHVIEDALRRQFNFALLEPGDPRVDPSVIAAFVSDAPGLDALRALRSEVAARGTQARSGRRTIAVIGADRVSDSALIAANLAVVSAQLGVETLLVDGGLTLPRQHDLFRASNRVGLASLLMGGVEPEAAIQPTAIEHLRLITTGPDAPNPGELLEVGLFGRLGRAASAFGSIIIDLSSVAHDNIPVTVASEADGVIIVARRGRSRLAVLSTLSRRLAERGARVLGTVIVR